MENAKKIAKAANLPSNQIYCDICYGKFSITRETLREEKVMLHKEETAQTHEVTMTFTPPGWNIGLICLAAGIVVLILFYRYDKKHNAVLLAIAREKRQAADGKQPEPAKAVSAKPTTSTKSVSEKTETTSKNAEKKESKPPTEEKPKESEAEDVADKKLDDSEQKTEDSDSKAEEATDSDSESK